MLTRKKIIVQFGQFVGEDKLVLNYVVRQGLAAEIWLDCLKKSIPMGFCENDRFYNLPNHPKNNIDTLINKLRLIIQQLNKIEPDRKIPDVDLSDLKNSLNHLHLNFAHSHLVENSINQQNMILMRDFNTAIHAIEDNMSSNSPFFTELKIPPAHVVLTFNTSNKVTIPDECYKDFELTYSFGTLYINYAQIGKQIFEMYLSKDDQLADEHIQPSRYFSADTYFWFGPNLGHFFETRAKKTIKEWFYQRKSRFSSLGLEWGDPKLSIGKIAVADLEDRYDLAYKIKEFQEHLAKFDFIESVEII